MGNISKLESEKKPSDVMLLLLSFRNYGFIDEKSSELGFLKFW